MAHRYRHPIRVTHEVGYPRSFSWRSAEHVIVEVFATWHLRDRWWEPSAQDADKTSASDRYYYRVHCSDGLICDLYYDAVADGWVLDRVHD